MLDNEITLSAHLTRAIESARVERKAAGATLAAPTSGTASHPNHAAYTAGGLLTPFDFGPDQIFPLIGLAHTPASVVCAACAATDERGEQLPTCLKALCNADAKLDEQGYATCSDLGLLKRGRIDGFWLKRPGLGLGQWVKLFGFEATQAAAMRGVFTWTGATIGALLARSAHAYLDAPFGAALVHLAATDDGRLARRGAMALHQTARERYFARRASFEAYAAAAADTGWREKPPRSRQGHLGVTTARAKGVPVPAERRRGNAADWLEHNGANVRFVEEGR